MSCGTGDPKRKEGCPGFKIFLDRKSGRGEEGVDGGVCKSVFIRSVPDPLEYTRFVGLITTHVWLGTYLGSGDGATVGSDSGDVPGRDGVVKDTVGGLEPGG